jgi:hypothetical protein
MARKETFAVGNQVRVRQSGGGTGDTIYEIVALSGFRCMIREIGMAPNGKRYAAQRFDTSLLTHAVTDEMLDAFSFGSIRAKR